MKNFNQNRTDFLLELETTNVEHATRQLQEVILEGGKISGVYRATPGTFSNLSRKGFNVGIKVLSVPILILTLDKIGGWIVDFHNQYR